MTHHYSLKYYNISILIITLYIHTQKEPMSMTAPVLTSKVPNKRNKGSGGKGTTTGSTTTTTTKMAFVLPFEKNSLSDIPSPTDKRVIVDELPEETVAVVKFR